MKKGKFIVFEGIDGSGKSTLSNLLFEKLNQSNVPIHKTFEPTDSPIGSVIRNILNKRIVADEKTIGALFLADRLDHINNPINGIKSYLEQDLNVISDRYYYSSYAYHPPHLPLEWIIDANKICAEELRPDIVFFLEISAEISLKRLTASRRFHDLFETKERIEKVITNYRKAIEAEGHKDNVVVIDGEQPLEVLLDIIWERTSSLLGVEIEEKIK